MSLFSRSGKKQANKIDPVEDLLLTAKKTLKIPRHIAIIMDGNGRWAKNRNMPRAFGHKTGSKAVRKTIESSVKLGVEYLSLYTFSADNWGRPQTEVDSLMRLIEDNLIKELPELHAQDVKVTALGRVAQLPQPTKEAFQRAMNETKDNNALHLQVAVNYSGYNEILDAIAKLPKDRITLTEEEFKTYLYAPESPYPELLIRTGGEFRISNFLLWQIAYAELWFTDILWPDFNEKALVQAISEYSKRERRFGGVTTNV